MTIAIFTGSRSLPHGVDDACPVVVAVEKAMGESSWSFVGDCPTGLDHLVRELWCTFGSELCDFRVFDAYWKSEGRSAGPKRNSRMVRAAAALAEALGVELVCHAWPLGESRGTRDCMRKAKAAGARVVVHTEAGES